MFVRKECLLCRGCCWRAWRTFYFMTGSGRYLWLIKTRIVISVQVLICDQAVVSALVICVHSPAWASWNVHAFDVEDPVHLSSYPPDECVRALLFVACVVASKWSRGKIAEDRIKYILLWGSSSCALISCSRLVLLMLMIINSFSLKDLDFVKVDDGVFPEIPDSFRRLDAMRKTGSCSSNIYLYKSPPLYVIYLRV